MAKKASRLERLKASLAKKEAAFESKLEAHFDAVRQANGQPLNDKRNGAATLSVWDRQMDGLRRVQSEIEKTAIAIEREEQDAAHVNAITAQLPAAIRTRLAAGDLIQWRKHPNTFFVSGVDKARIVWLPGRRQLAHKYANQITDPVQRRTFASAFNGLSADCSKE